MIKVDRVPCYLTEMVKRGSAKKNTAKKWILINSEGAAPWIHKYKKFVPASEQQSFSNAKWSTWLVHISVSEQVTLVLSPKAPELTSHYGYLEESRFHFWKHQGGALIQKECLLATEAINVESLNLEEHDWLGFLSGIEMGCYQYSQVHFSNPSKSSGKVKRPTLYLSKDIKGLTPQIIREAQAWGFGQNLSRHLVNLPPGECYPSVVAEYVKKYFNDSASVTISVMGAREIQNEKMGLLYAVGKGSEHEPKFIQIHYTPKVKKGIKRIALVGKGVTFDTGGLDIKPSTGMRLMKKDMAGAAAVIGTLYYVIEAQLPVQVSAYVPLAENSVDAKSMRPSDVFTARNGLTVEIHNTDAEGRLILADALDYAVTRPNKPDAVINVATLTGAIKTTLGLEIAGLFSNQDQLAEGLLESAQEAGDLVWRVPLYSRYSSQFTTPFADLVNAVDGWAGPITAALFLERFIKGVPWAHLDIYGWTDKTSGVQSHAGGNGQAVGLLNAFIRKTSQS